MPRVRGDFAKYLASAAAGKLDQEAASFGDDACVGVVLASADYPGASAPLAGIGGDVSLPDGRAAFWGSSTRSGDLVDASGGRVLTVTAVGPNLENARTNAYAAVDELARRNGAGTSLSFAPTSHAKRPSLRNLGRSAGSPKDHIMYQQPYRPQRFAAPTISTQALLGQVLGIVAGGFVVTAAAAYLTASFNLPHTLSWIALLVGFGFIMGINGVRANQGLSLVLFYAFTACEGIGLGPTIAYYARGVDGPNVIVEAAATTAMGMAVLAALAFLTSFDYRKLSGLGFGLLLALVVLSLINVFVHFLHPTTIAWATLAVFTILTLVDFARVRAQGSGANAVQLATSIYLDAINIFLALLRIFGGGRDR